ncbi:MAG: methylated-DNA--[protein]-cysteine S-methyltransferase [Alphaproteobacteria bacterium]|nr:methylated-DNA--[protein]-cysteine S-methyltransferase [Pelagibacteraceae bacterium]
METASFKTELGWISVKKKSDIIFSLSFGKTNKISNFTNIKNQINSYALGKLKSFKIDYHFEGTPLQKKIWKELSKIKYGEVTTYRQIAKKVGTSPRYVGNVCGQNKLLLIIPCHRVIRSDGKLGGFSGRGGIKLKKKLLSLEQNVQ